MTTPYIVRPKTARMLRWIAARKGGAFSVSRLAKAMNMKDGAVQRRLYMMRPAVAYLGEGMWKAAKQP